MSAEPSLSLLCAALHERQERAREIRHDVHRLLKLPRSDRVAAFASELLEKHRELVAECDQLITEIKIRFEKGNNQ